MRVRIEFTQTVEGYARVPSETYRTVVERDIPEVYCDALPEIRKLVRAAMHAAWGYDYAGDWEAQWPEENDSEPPETFRVPNDEPNSEQSP